MFFCELDYSKISRIFCRNWLGLNNLCEILKVSKDLVAVSNKHDG